MIFKTLEEHQAYNKKQLESDPFHKMITQSGNVFEEFDEFSERALNKDGLSYFEQITENSQASKIRKLDHSFYNSIEWVDTFLPKVNLVKGKGLWVYDGAQLFDDLAMAESRQFRLDKNKQHISLISYTYPKGVLAETVKSLARASEHEVLSFIEVNKNKTVEIYFKFGNRFKEYLHKVNDLIHINEIESKSYLTDIESLKNYFSKKLVHYNMMNYILDVLGVKEEVINFSNYNKLFTSKVNSFIEDFRVLEKYKIRVFIEPTQVSIHQKTDGAKNKENYFSLNKMKFMYG